MHTKIYLSDKDLPETGLDRLIRRLRVQGIELVLQPDNFPYVYSTSTSMTPSAIMKTYIKEFEKCESDD